MRWPILVLSGLLMTGCGGITATIGRDEKGRITEITTNRAARFEAKDDVASFKLDTTMKIPLQDMTSVLSVDLGREVLKGD